MRPYISISLILVLAGCNLKNNDLASEPISTVRLHGTVVNSPGGAITLEVPDPLAYDAPLVLDSITLDSAGNFSLAVVWNKPDHARINFGDYYIPLYLMPGDSMHVEYDLEADAASFTGRGAAVNNYLQELEALNEQFRLYGDLPMDKHSHRLDSLTTARMELLDALRPQATAEHPSHPFLEIAKVETEANRLGDLIQYPWLFQFVTKAETQPELPSEIRSQIDAYPLSNDAWFPSKAYQEFVETRLSDMIRDTLKLGWEVYEERHYRFADSLLTGRMRELQLAKVVQKSLTYGSGIEMGEVLLQRYMTAHPASHHVPYLENLQARAARMAVGRPAPSFNALDLDGRKITLEELRGQLVYMDIWATWCMPCRRSLPDIQELTKDMEGQPVQVVLISVDEDQEAWRKLALETPGPHHIWVEGGLSSGFAKDYNLSGVPRYMLLDREGVILESNGPYPKKAKEKLEALLKEGTAC